MNSVLLRSILDYDPETGIFTWLVNPSQRVTAGSQAGTTTAEYSRICYKRKHFMAHNLAWVYMTGACPGKGYEVDHIDGNPLNNRWDNLRLTTHVRNCQNKKGKAHATSEWKGVSWSSARRKWVSQIKDHGKTSFLGLFSDEREAAEVYIFAALELHGEYARFA